MLPFHSFLSFYNTYHYYFLVHECHKEHKQTVITFEAYLRKRVKNTNNFSSEWCSEQPPEPLQANTHLSHTAMSHCLYGNYFIVSKELLWLGDLLMLFLSCPLGTGDGKDASPFCYWMMQKYNLFLLKNQKWQSSHSTMQETPPMAQPGVEASIQYSSIFSIFGAKQLQYHPVKIHLSSMGDSPK